MKILVGSFQCESNTFCDNKVNTEDFEVFEKDEVLEKLTACEVFEEAGAQIFPLLYASALPGGEISIDAFEYYKDIFVNRIKEHVDIDGIYLYLHGSMYVENTGSGEQALVEAIRQEIGNDIPISLAMDFHANISPGLLKIVNAVNGFRTAPHTDHDDTERRAARSLLKCISNHYTGSVCAVHLPFLCGDAAVTDRAPFPAVTKMLKLLDNQSQIISSAFFNAQPWYDSPYTGACALVSAMDGCGLETAMEIAKLFWDGRELLKLDGAMKADDAVDYSLKNSGKVLFVSDSGDNTTAGARGSGTLMLKKYLNKNARDILICGIYDKENTDNLLHMEVGEQIEITLCRGFQEQQEQEVHINAALKNKGRVFGWAGDEVGEGVLLTCDGLDIVLTSARAAFTTPEHFAYMNVDPQSYKAIILKMGYLFPRLNEISDKKVLALSPGQSTNDFAALQYNRLKRKMYPIYKDIEWAEIEAKAWRCEL